ncbi:MAG: potassium-transporting ATPase KdpC subunit [Solirubrobacterales bacterium]|jgi:K+-transporting ATPase ATPase C chain|nr:potassium-transporting ATPase KdpC subunit [Solirubrobacterales bacterium]
MKKDLRTGLIAIVVMTLFLGLAYPLAITGISQVAFPGHANGSKVSFDGRVVGSKLIGQEFTEPVIGKNGKPVLDEEGEEVRVPDKAYFQPRPSATGYSGDVTFFGNAAPNSVEAREEVREYMKAYLHLEKPYDKSLTSEGIPVDAVTQSASGVDPEISQANARIQAHRIAAVRHLPLTRVEELISANTHGRSLGVLGEPGVNVLELNIALDKEAPIK